MTYNLEIGRRNVYSQGNGITDIFEIVGEKLEKGKYGSRFPLFQRLSKREDSEKSVNWSEISELTDEFVRISREISDLPYPVASAHVGKTEVKYTRKLEPYGIRRSAGYPRNTVWGVNEKGIFVAERIRGKLESQKYFDEVKKGETHFEDFKELFGTGLGFTDKVDRISHNFKSVGMLFDQDLDKILKVAQEARQKRKPLVVVH